MQYLAPWLLYAFLFAADVDILESVHIDMHMHMYARKFARAWV